MEVHEVREVSSGHTDVRWFASEGAARAYVAGFPETMGKHGENEVLRVAAIEVPTTAEGMCRLINARIEAAGSG